MSCDGGLVKVPVDHMSLLVRWLWHVVIHGIDAKCGPAE
jgi:hypothetical protein